MPMGFIWLILDEYGCPYSIFQKVLECHSHVGLSCGNFRLGAVAGKGGKPTMVLTKDFHVWLLNSTSEAMEMDAEELFGFGTGQYQNQVVSRAFHIA